MGRIGGWSGGASLGADQPRERLVGPRKVDFDFTAIEKSLPSNSTIHIDTLLK